MSEAIITIKDNNDGTINVTCRFEPGTYDVESMAHRIAVSLVTNYANKDEED